MGEIIGRRQLPVGHRPSSIWTLKSSSKCWKADLIGPNPSCPWPHNELASHGLTEIAHELEVSRPALAARDTLNDLEKVLHP